MKNALRILCIVACLAAVWLVTRGSNGCAPMPDGTGILYVDGDSSKDDQQENAEVYGSGKIGDLDAAGDAAIPIQWYTSLEGNIHTGVVTIISTKSNGKTKHLHHQYSIEKGKSYKIDIQNEKMR